MSPTAGERFDAGASIAVTANATDADGSVAKVDFYANGAFIGTDSSGPNPYAVTWSNAPAGSYALTAVATDNDGAATTSNAVNIIVSENGSNLPDSWSDQDIGAVGLDGSASYEGGVYTIRASGDNIYDRADSLRYVSQPLVGDGQIIARVAAIDYTHELAMAGVMIRESLSADSRHAAMLVMPSNTARFRYRTSTAGTTDSRSPGAGLDHAALLG
ncbi:MAG: Ig-like domain-containing protein [Pyrinomonadaceae bacterium]